MICNVDFGHLPTWYNDETLEYGIYRFFTEYDRVVPVSLGKLSARSEMPKRHDAGEFTTANKLLQQGILPNGAVILVSGLDK